MSKTNLFQLQQWLNTVITTSGNLRQKFYAAGVNHHLHPEKVVANRRGVNAYNRLQVYINGYVARLLECLKADYPLLQQFMTEPVFNHFATAYLAYKKPSSYTLFKLGAEFPQFLKDTRPQNLQEEQMDFYDLPYALALYERAFLKVYRAKGLEQKTPSNIEAATPFFLFDLTTVQVSPCLEILNLEFPILDFIKALRQEETPIVPEKETSYIALTRINYRVRSFHLEDWQYHFLQAAQQPISTHQAAEMCAQRTDKSVEAIMADLLFFLPMAYDNNLLIKIGLKK